MQGQTSQKEQVEDAVSSEDRDETVLILLLGHSPWTVDELARELDGNSGGATDSVARLAGAGLAHRLGEFVFLSRAGRRADQILG